MSRHETHAKGNRQGRPGNSEEAGRYAEGLALTSGTGLRFVIDLEKGKETCQIGKALTILHTLGIRLTLAPPTIPTKEE